MDFQLVQGHPHAVYASALMNRKCDTCQVLIDFGYKCTVCVCNFDICPSCLKKCVYVPPIKDLRDDDPRKQADIQTPKWWSPTDAPSPSPASSSSISASPAVTPPNPSPIVSPSSWPAPPSASSASLLWPTESDSSTSSSSWPAPRFPVSNGDSWQAAGWLSASSSASSSSSSSSLRVQSSFPSGPRRSDDRRKFAFMFHFQNGRHLFDFLPRTNHIDTVTLTLTPAIEAAIRETAIRYRDESKTTDWLKQTAHEFEISSDLVLQIAKG